MQLNRDGEKIKYAVISFRRASKCANSSIGVKKNSASPVRQLIEWQAFVSFHVE